MLIFKSLAAALLFAHPTVPQATEIILGLGSTAASEVRAEALSPTGLERVARCSTRCAGRSVRATRTRYETGDGSPRRVRLSIGQRLNRMAGFATPAGG